MAESFNDSRSIAFGESYFHAQKLAELGLGCFVSFSVLFNMVLDYISFRATGQTKGLTAWRWSVQWECDGGQR